MIEPGSGAFEDLLQTVAGFVSKPGLHMDLPLDVRGTVFQEAIWCALSRIPPGSTLSYAALAARAGKAGAARSAGTACGSNPVALLIPCHRAVRGDGSVGGYAWSVARKRELLRREAQRR